MIRMNVKLRILLIGGMCWQPAVAWGLINPNFTPIHLTDQATCILTVQCEGNGGGDRVKLKVTGAVKGKAPAALTIDLAQAPKQHGEAARKQFAAASGKAMLLFSGKFEDQDVGYLHAEGMWMRLEGGRDGNWDFLIIDDQMPATWAGGTDMLLRCVKYILASQGDAVVPVGSGTAWRRVVKVGASAAKVKAVAAVDLGGDGRLCLYVACPGGDLVLKPVAGKPGFEDVSAKIKLAAKSVASAWDDFNADGLMDLASFDGKALTLWQQAADGTFSPVKPAGKFSIPASFAGLGAVRVGKGARPALVVGGSAPRLLKLVGNNAFEAVDLVSPKDLTAKLGKPQEMLIADFNDDAVPDLLQPFEKGGLVFFGKSDGSFEAPKPCGVNCANGGRAVAADFDADGCLDVLAAGAEGVRVFQNLKNGSFEEKMALSGEIAYKAQPFASWCGVCDFNNDSRQDIFIAYEGEPLLLYFNRGFRSFGQAPDLELSLAEEIPPLASGQQAGVFADFDRDGAQDFVIVLENGEIWCAYNDLGGEDALCMKARLAPEGAFPSPMTVTAWQKNRCLGALPVRAGFAPAFFGIEEAGRYTLKWRFPGGQWQSREVTVEDRPVDAVLGQARKPPTRKASGQGK